MSDTSYHERALTANRSDRAAPAEPRRIWRPHHPPLPPRRRQRPARPAGPPTRNADSHSWRRWRHFCRAFWCPLRSLCIAIVSVLESLEATHVGEDWGLGTGRVAEYVVRNAPRLQGFWLTRVCALVPCSLPTSERAPVRGIVVKGNIATAPATKNIAFLFFLADGLHGAEGLGLAIMRPRSKTKVGEWATIGSY